MILREECYLDGLNCDPFTFASECQELNSYYHKNPLYHVSHLGGIFSSFNVETVSHVDFYKASFPARYGGRISSITDITMREPDFNKFGGKVSVGLLNANVYVTGPIIKDRTAFSAACAARGSTCCRLLRLPS